MIELSLILFIAFCAMLCAAGLARWNSALALGSVEQSRILSALGRASDSIFWQTLRRSLPVILAASSVLLVACQPWTGPWQSALIAAGWSTGFIVAGATACALVAFVAIHSSLRVSSRLLEASNGGLEHAGVVLLRGSGISALLADASATALVVLAFALHTGEFSGISKVPLSGLKAAAWALPALGLGGALAGLMLQSTGIVFSASAKLAQNLARAGHRQVDDDHDPTLVCNLAADHVGAIVARTTDAFLCSLLSQIAVLALTACAVLRAPTLPLAPLSLLILPLLVRAMGLVAAPVGILATRIDPSADPHSAMVRGLWTTFAVTAGGMAGACAWLLGPSWLGGFVPAVIGCAAGCLLGPALIWPVKWRALQASAPGTPPVLGPLGASLEGAIVVLLLAALALIGAYFAGTATGFASGGTLGLILALAGMGSVSAFMMTLNIAEPLSNSVVSIAALRLSEVSPAACAHAKRVHQAAASSACSARVFFVISGGLAAVLTALAGAEASAKSGGVGAVSLGAPTVLWGGALGMAAVLAFCGLLLRAISSGTHRIMGDISRQLATAALQSDTPFTPDYKSPLDIATAEALNQASTLGVIAVAVPLGFTVLTRLAASSAVESVLSFATLGILTALCIGVCSSGLATLSAPRAPSSVTTPVLDTAAMLYSPTTTPVSVVVPQGAPALDFRAELLFEAVAPTAQLFAKSLAIICLMLSPFIP
ncbi:MAG TPA: sodium/proton-translocating pyrophosphatase [Polyangiaceae bacterium]|nr:sodium/proton-translocating pyrophosphatase [Polyangiaceae bacterium]